MSTTSNHLSNEQIKSYYRERVRREVKRGFADLFELLRKKKMSLLEALRQMHLMRQKEKSF